MNEGVLAARFPTFYVDDSACDIAGAKHIILSALTFPDEQKAIADWLAKKHTTRLSGTTVRFRWNNAGFRLRFDKDIIEDRRRLKNHLSGFYPPCVGLSEHDSECEQLVQYADFLAAAIKLKIDFGLGNRNPRQKIAVACENSGARKETELSFYFFAALRYCLWGRILDVGYGVSTNDPRKMVMGRGLIVNSSAEREVVDSAISFIDGDYMGCIH